MSVHLSAVLISASLRNMPEFRRFCSSLRARVGAVGLSQLTTTVNAAGAPAPRPPPGGRPARSGRPGHAVTAVSRASDVRWPERPRTASARRRPHHHRTWRTRRTWSLDSPSRRGPRGQAGWHARRTVCQRVAHQPTIRPGPPGQGGCPAARRSQAGCRRESNCQSRRRGLRGRRAGVDLTPALSGPQGPGVLEPCRRGLRGRRAPGSSQPAARCQAG